MSCNMSCLKSEQSAVWQKIQKNLMLYHPTMEWCFSSDCETPEIILHASISKVYCCDNTQKNYNTWWYLMLRLWISTPDFDCYHLPTLQSLDWSTVTESFLLLTFFFIFCIMRKPFVLWENLVYYITPFQYNLPQVFGNSIVFLLYYLDIRPLFMWKLTLFMCKSCN